MFHMVPLCHSYSDSVCYRACAEAGQVTGYVWGSCRLAYTQTQPLNQMKRTPVWVLGYVYIGISSRSDEMGIDSLKIEGRNEKPGICSWSDVAAE